MPKAICGVVLAAGYGSVGEQRKVHLTVDRKTLVRRAVDRFDETGVSSVLAVIDPRDETTRRSLEGSRATIVEAATAQVSAGVAAALEGATPDADAYAFVPATLALITPELLAQSLSAFEETADGILATVYQAVPGYPMIVERRFRDPLLAAVKEQSDPLGLLLLDHPRDVFDLHVITDAPIFDVDDESDYEELHRRLGLSVPESSPSSSEGAGV